ncbi:MAG: nitroreductase family protein [Vicinamibacteria bacterium]|nr:nitroreductase family protein [Vicinamibacteria bacterium]
MRTRRTIRAYEETPLSRAMIEEIVDCGRLAATAMNNQPWSFVVVQEVAARARLQEILGHAEFLRQAPCCIVIFHREIDFAVEDASAATQNILNAAWAHGLGSCWIAGRGMDYAPRVAELLGAPKDLRLFALVSLGRPAENPQPEKRPLSEQLSWERFSEPSGDL